MWRGILLGKMLISITVSIVVSYVCFSKGNAAEDWSTALRWHGLGVFFVLLAVAFLASLVLLHRRRLPPAR